MAIFRKQFIEVIEWVKDGVSEDESIMYKFPVHDNEIKMGAQLTVREGQVAIFVSGGKVCDVFEAGRHTLITKNIPVLTKVLSLPFGTKSPFKADVYFVDVTKQIGNKWGTSEPITIRDNDFGMIRLRARGRYTYFIDDPVRFLTEMMGHRTNVTKKDINGEMRSHIVSNFSDLTAETKVPFLDLAMEYNELSEALTNKMDSFKSKYFIKISDLVVENVTLPEAVLEAIDQRSSMAAMGNLNQYTQYSAAKAMGDAANNPNGGGANGMGMGMGMAMGQQMMNAMNQNNQPQQQQVQSVACTSCGQPIAQGAKFCRHCGQSQTPAGTSCSSCGHALKPGAKFCPECGTSQGAKNCSNCGHALKPGAKFCPECGSRA